MIRRFLIFATLFVCATAYADECAQFKMHPTVNVITPDWTKSVVQPLEPMSLWHGNVVATLVGNYDLVADITSVDDGFCVGLKSVNATIGYTDFLVKIDIRHRPDTCGFDAILSHEDGHIRAYLSVIDDYADDIRAAVYSAADAVMPVFVKNSSQLDAAVAGLNAELQAHPDIILINQKIHAAEEMRNKRIDQNDNGDELRHCYE